MDNIPDPMAEVSADFADDRIGTIDLFQGCQTVVQKN